MRKGTYDFWLCTSDASQITESKEKTKVASKKQKTKTKHRKSIKLIPHA